VCSAEKPSPVLLAAAAQFWWRGNQGKAGAAQQPGQKLGSSNAQAAELLSLLRRAQPSSAQLADPSRPGECAAKSYITRPAPVVASGGGGVATRATTRHLGAAVDGPGPPQASGAPDADAPQIRSASLNHTY
jgi:hypothetical protein